MESTFVLPSEFPATPLLNEASNSADAAFCAAVVLAHPLILLADQSTVNRLHDVAVRSEQGATAEDWKLITELVGTFAEAERSLP
jgi:hypothetical protein